MDLLLEGIYFNGSQSGSFIKFLPRVLDSSQRLLFTLICRKAQPGMKMMGKVQGSFWSFVFLFWYFVVIRNQHELIRVNL